MFGIVIFLLIFDIIILVVWQVIDPFKIIRKTVDDVCITIFTWLVQWLFFFYLIESKLSAYSSSWEKVI